MHVRRSRTIRPATYEAETLEVLIDSDDLPRVDGEVLQAYLARMEYEALKRLIGFEIFKGHLKPETGVSELKRFRKYHGLDG